MQSPQQPISYLITSGQTTAATTSSSKDFQTILQLIAAAVAVNIDLIQVREKALTTKVLYELVTRAAALTSSSTTKLLVNDRADVASSAGVDGVHLTTRSLPASVVRQSFGNDFLIGVSTHSLAEALAAREARADFVVFGPVFQTPSKEKYGPPVGLEQLSHVCAELNPFPVLAIGGVSEENFADCLSAGAQGIASIRMFDDPTRLSATVARIHGDFL
ncbi:MAG: thiamine phosphate synthase [Blastocatellia bacterium]|nr:thiamine phosphate synthase [Blastocatellia bacterium]